MEPDPLSMRRGGLATQSALRILSTLERKPAQRIAQPLVVEHQFSDLVGELGALPLALHSAGRLAFGSRRRGPGGLDRVGGGAEFVGRHMRHRRGLTGGERGVPSRSAQLSCRSLGMAGRIPGLRHLDIAARPCPRQLDRPAGPRIRRLSRLEEVQNVLRAVGRPYREEAMVVVI